VIITTPCPQKNPKLIQSRKKERSFIHGLSESLLPLSLETAHLPAHFHEHETAKNTTLAKAGKTPYSIAARPSTAARKLPAGETTLPPALLSVAAGAAARFASEADELTAAVEVEESVLVAVASV
jgi:hypothetical protein